MMLRWDIEEIGDRNTEPNEERSAPGCPRAAAGRTREERRHHGEDREKTVPGSVPERAFGTGCQLLVPARPRCPLPRDAIRARYFPNVVLRTHENRTVRFYDDLIKDKVVILNFMYARCDGVCPSITANLVKVQRLLGDRIGRGIFMYSITLKAEQDTPGALAEYVAMHDIGPGWLFLTGDPADVELLRRKLGFVNPDPALDADSAEHIGNIRYGNERRQLWGACPALASASWIVESLGWLDGGSTRL
jgi:protein SCO1/2